MNTKETELKTAPIPKLLLSYSLPAIIGMIVNALYNVIDRIFIGNIPEVGSIAMAGLGVTLPFMSMIHGFGLLLAVGGATSISLKQGEGKGDEAEAILGNTIVLAGVVSVVLTVIGLSFRTEILTLFGASEESIPYAKAYVDIILLGTVFSLYGVTFSYLIRGDGSPKLSATMMVIGCVMNIGLDALFIYGFHMGIQGAALATVLSQGVTMGIGCMYYRKGKSNVPLMKKHIRLKISYCKQIFLIGLTPFFAQVASSITHVIANNRLSEYGGDLAVGALATIMSVFSMIGMPIVGLSVGIQPIVSYNYGAKKYERVEAVLKLAMIVATLFLTITWGITRLYPEQIVSIFNKDKELLDITVDGMGKFLVCFPLLGINYIGTNFIQSTGQAKLAMLLSLLRQVILLMPLFAFLPKILQLDGIWYAQPIADILSCIVTTILVIMTLKRCRREEKQALSST